MVRYATSPPFSPEIEDYSDLVGRVAGWSESHGCRGTLVYTDNSMLDPWLVAQVVLERSEALRPLVAVQPAYMHPYSVAKLITSLNQITGRGVDVNWVAGGFVRDLTALGDATPHDERYERLIEFATIVDRLLESERPVTLAGKHYEVENLQLAPGLPAEERPVFTVSGSSSAGLGAAKSLGAVAVQYPDPRFEGALRSEEVDLALGIRVGVIARDSDEEAWAIAHSRFPPDRQGKLVHRLAMAVSDSEWHRRLSAASAEVTPEDPFWMVPFENYKTFCPYLVGGFDRVASVLAFYIARGYSTFITDVPFSPEDEACIQRVFDLAERQASTERTGAGERES